MAVSTSQRTTSFVAEVLATAGRLDKDDLNEKLGKLSKQIEQVKAEVYDALQKKYCDFFPNFKNAVDLSSRVTTLSGEMELVSSTIETEMKSKLDVSRTEFQDLSAQLNELTQILAILDRLVKLHEAQKEVDLAMQHKNYLKAAEHMQISEKLLNNPWSKRNEEIKILKSLMNNHSNQMQLLISELSEAWGDYIKWNFPAEETKGKMKIAAQLTIAGSADKQVVKGTILAMEAMNLLDAKLNIFSKRVMEHIFEPLYKTSAALKFEVEDKNLGIKVFLSNSKTPSTPKEMFTTTLELLEAINQHMLGIKLEGSTTLMRLMGEGMVESFHELVIKECLASTIPTNNRDLKQYSKVIDGVSRFQNKLIALKFLSHDDNVFLEYVQNINVLYANKKSEELLQRGRELMTSEIHNMVKVSASETEESTELPNGEVGRKHQKSESAGINGENKLSGKSFHLPNCQISVSVLKLVQLAYESLHEATTSSPECAIQIFYSVRNLFELFCNVVPTYHKESLLQLPQLAALHHNNCMYIAHHLLTLGHQYRQGLPSPLNEGAATFVDMVPKVRRLGTECFLQQMTLQKKQLLEYTTSAGGFNEVSNDDNFATARQAIKQALHQLQRLHNVWVPVLPHNIYFKAIGTLASSVITEIINSITALEDISAKDATQLHALLELITEKTGDFFDTGDKEVIVIEKYITKWNKLKELILLLNSSLVEITERWAASKGPLANEFAANEVKQLVRALFQNTDQRAKVLAEIR